MKHGKKKIHLGRKSAHRKSLLANLACSLIEHKRIKTTLAKGKALRMYIEPLITKSKNDTTHSRRVVFSYLKQKEAVTELFGDISSKVSDRNGGYTRILKLGNRLGDNASMCMIELVDYNSEYTTDKPKAKKSRRSRRGGSSSIKTAPEEVPAEEVVEEAPVEEVPAEEVVEETPVEEVPAEEFVEEAPVEEVPGEEVVEEAPAVEEVPEKNQPEDDKNEENKKQD